MTVLAITSKSTIMWLNLGKALGGCYFILIVHFEDTINDIYSQGSRDLTHRKANTV